MGKRERERNLPHDRHQHDHTTIIKRWTDDNLQVLTNTGTKVIDHPVRCLQVHGISRESITVPRAITSSIKTFPFFITSGHSLSFQQRSQNKFCARRHALEHPKQLSDEIQGLYKQLTVPSSASLFLWTEFKDKQIYS